MLNNGILYHRVPDDSPTTCSEIVLEDTVARALLDGALTDASGIERHRLEADVEAKCVYVAMTGVSEIVHRLHGGVYYSAIRMQRRVIATAYPQAEKCYGLPMSLDPHHIVQLGSPTKFRFHVSRILHLSSREVCIDIRKTYILTHTRDIRVFRWYPFIIRISSELSASMIHTHGQAWG